MTCSKMAPNRKIVRKVACMEGVALKAKDAIGSLFVTHPYGEGYNLGNIG